MEENYYKTNYPNYFAQNPPEKLEFYLSLIRKWTGPKSKVFELGVGLGLFFSKLSIEFDAFGSDPNEYGVAETKKRIPQPERLRVGSYEAIKSGEKFDAIVAWDVLEHVPTLHDCLVQFRSALNSKGVLIGVVPVYKGPLGWLVKLLDKDPTHLTKVGYDDWINLLEKAGYEVVESGGILRYLVGAKYLHFTEPKPVLRLCQSAMYFVARPKV